MALVFEPHRAIYVLASSPHPKNTEYRVAWGYEKWDIPQPVTKVQMVYTGKVAGRISPSYPDDTSDEQAVDFAKTLLKQGLGTASSKHKIVMVMVDESKETIDEDVIARIGDAITDMHTEILAGYSASADYEQKYHVESSLYALLYNVYISK